MSGIFSFLLLSLFFFFNDTATTEIYPLSLHDALPIWPVCRQALLGRLQRSLASRSRPSRGRGSNTLGHHHQLKVYFGSRDSVGVDREERSEEHTSELQSHSDLVCRLLLEKKKKRLYRVLGSHEERPAESLGAMRVHLRRAHLRGWCGSVRSQYNRHRSPLERRLEL